MSEKDELRDRVEAKRKRLEARLAELKADSRAEARDERERLEKQLADVGASLREGWENLSEKAAGKLNEWLSDDRA